MPKYGVATLLGEYPVGYEFKQADTPLHVTHVDSVEVDLSVDELAGKLGQVVADHEPFEVMALYDTNLGPEKDIPVTMLDLTPALAGLHQTIVDVLDHEKGVHKRPQFLRDNYTPHVSIYGKRRIEVGKPVRIENLSIAQKISEGDDASFRVLANIALGNGQSR